MAEEITLKNYTAEDIQQQIKPLSQNGFVAFFQKIWRWWLGVWYAFSEKHPKLSKLIYQVVFFFVFSMGVTIWQYIVMAFLPYLLGGLASVSFIWPAINIGSLTYVNAQGDKMPLQFAIFNEPAILRADGTYDPTGGLSNFLAFEIAVFTAQCINFPLQRNITFRSHGNPWYQAMWYFIGWVLISVFVNAVWGIVVPFVRDLWGWPSAIWNLLKTFITGGISMIIFFFIFLIIFPDNEKAAKEAEKKVAKLTAAGASQEKIDEANHKMKVALYKAEMTRTEKEEIRTKALANTKAIKYFSLVNKQGTAEDALQKAFDEAVAAIKEKEEALAARQKMLAAEPVA